MRNIYFLLVSLFVFNFGFGQIISQYVDTDSGTAPKGIEIWNNTASQLDFSTNNLVIKKYVDGSLSAITEATINSGTLAVGEVLVIGGSDLSTWMSNNYPSVTFINDPFTFNGNDALEVVYGGTTTDVFGTIGTDPGTAWTGSGVSTADQNIELKPGITTGTTTGFTDPSTRFNTNNENPTGVDGLNGFGVPPAGNDTQVQFTDSFASVAEDGNSFGLTLEIVNENATATTVDVALTSGNATDINDYTTQTVTFPSNSSANQTVTLTITDNSLSDGDKDLTFALQNVSGGNNAKIGGRKTFDLIIVDDESLGLQITSMNTDFIIDFDNTTNANNGTFDGSGFSPSPSVGQLNSETLAVTGLSDGNLAFGGTATSGDFARGTSTGGVGTGGIYAFQTSTGNFSLGVQPIGSDFAPGTLTLKVQNQTGQEVNEVDLSYIIYVFNNEGRSSSLNFSYSDNDINYTGVTALDFTTPEIADVSPVWVNHDKSTIIRGLSIADGGFFYLRWTGDDVSGSGSRDEFSLDDISVSFLRNFVYNGTAWSPQVPGGNSTSNDNLIIESGTALINTATTANEVRVEASAVLDLNANLTANKITFKSDSNGSAQLADATGVTITGEVTVERFIPAGDNSRRAFRFLTSSVTTSSTINDNWQEGVNNTGINYPTDNKDPNTGFGIHITGSTTGAKGFDATPSGNPSMFTFDNAFLADQPGETQGDAWSPISDTDTNTLSAGEPYLTFIRGDRSINVTSNSATPTNTTLRSTGDLHIGDYSPTLSTENEFFSLIANPYQAIVDFNQLTFSGDVNSNNMFIWNPNTSTRGAYETITTAANQMMQPAQSIFVQNSTTVTNTPGITFTEVAKKTDGLVTGVFSEISVLETNLTLYNDNDLKLDVMKFRFEANANNSIDDYDAGKLFNPDENLASVNNNTLLSVERRDIPQADEIVPLFINQYQFDDYKFKIDLNNWDTNIDIYIIDNYLNTETIIEPNQDYSFNIDTNIPESTASDRFSLSFDNITLGINDNVFGDGFSLYPNPTQGQFSIKTNGLISDDVSVKLYNMLGQQVLYETFKAENNGKINVNASGLSAGVYMVELMQNEQRFTSKLIVE